MDIRKRYLDLLRKSLVNELYIENDARMLYMAMCAQAGKRLNQEVLQKVGLSGHVTTLCHSAASGGPATPSRATCNSYRRTDRQRQCRVGSEHCPPFGGTKWRVRSYPVCIDKPYGDCQ